MQIPVLTMPLLFISGQITGPKRAGGRPTKCSFIQLFWRIEVVQGPVLGGITSRGLLSIFLEEHPPVGIFAEYRIHRNLAPPSTEELSAVFLTCHNLALLFPVCLSGGNSVGFRSPGLCVSSSPLAE